MSRTSKNGRTRLRAAEEEVEETGSHVLHAVQQIGSDAKEAVRNQYDNLRETASDYVEQGRDRVQALEKRVERRIKQQPLNSMLLVLGVGVALGFLCSRR